MMVSLRRLCLAAGLLLSMPLLAAPPAYQPLVDDLSRVAPTLDPVVLTHAVAACSAP
tara:strand:- start:167 stop:337 length:171 start_codon:yes stop_codon:yes gene_type:complete